MTDEQRARNLLSREYGKDHPAARHNATLTFITTSFEHKVRELAAEFIAVRNETKAELTAILGDDPVGRAKALVQQHERLARLHNDAGTTAEQLDEELQLADDAAEELGFERGSATPAEVIRKLATQCREADERVESLRAALVEKDAELAKKASDLERIRRERWETNEALSKAIGGDWYAAFKELQSARDSLLEANTTLKSSLARASMDAYALTQAIRDEGGAGGTMVPFPFEAVHRALASLIHERDEARESWRLTPPHERVLHCPNCGKQHLDIGEFATRVHRKHLCENTTEGPGTGCGHVWKPYEYATKGIESSWYEVSAFDEATKQRVTISVARTSGKSREAAAYLEGQGAQFVQVAAVSEPPELCLTPEAVVFLGKHHAEETARLRARVAELEQRGAPLGMASDPCPACGRFSRAETAGCDHCHYEDK